MFGGCIEFRHSVQHFYGGRWMILQRNYELSPNLCSVLFALLPLKV